MKSDLVDVEHATDEEHLFKRYGSILGARISPISAFGIRYFDKNYEKILRPIPKNSTILEIGPGSGNFTQYLLHKGYTNITICEEADDNVRSLSHSLGHRVEVVHGDAIDYLENSSNRFGLIYAAQIIEHFAYDDFIRFLKRCYTSLDKGGYIVFETINCANIVHGLYLRYCDYTHRMGFTPRSLRHFFMAVGDFSDLELMEIRPLGFLDCLYCFLCRIKAPADLNDSYCSANPSGFHRGIGKAAAIPLRSLSIRLSRWLSFLFLGLYEFEKIKIYTPFFAIVARKA